MFSQELDISGMTAMLGLGAVVLSTCWWKLRRPTGVPPGPVRIPIIGNNVISSSRSINSFVDLKKKYGNIVSMYLGNKLLVILNEYSVVREAFVTKGTDCAGRPENLILQSAINFHHPEEQGIALRNPTEEWKMQRNTCINILRSLGWGKSVIEENIVTECSMFSDHISSSHGQPTNPAEAIGVFTANIICSVLFGHRYEYTDMEFISFQKAINAMLFALENSSAVMYIPWLQPFIRKTNELRNTNSRYLADFYKRKFDEAKARIESGDSEDNDFITLYVKETMKNGKDCRIIEDWTMQLISEFFVAGSETTATTLQWALIFMANNPDIQKQVQQELDNVFGEGPQHIALSDRGKVPFTEATLCEIQRRGTIAAFGLPHEALKDVVISGYNVPKGTEIWANLYNVHHDERIWPEPQKFKPQRFLNEEGILVRKEELIPFSMGRRACLGEQVARQEMFLFFTHILKTFTICAPHGITHLDEEGVVGMAFKPKPFEVCFIPRF